MRALLLIGFLSSMGYSADFLTVPMFSPCDFPVPSDPKQIFLNHHFCNFNRRIPFLCDLHSQLTDLNIHPLISAFRKHSKVFTLSDGFPRLGVVLVRHLAQPISADQINSTEFGCMYNVPCLQLTPDLLHKIAHNTKSFTKYYTQTLFYRWFSVKRCEPSVLMVVVVEGILLDPRKLTSVNIYSENPQLNSMVTNIQLEATNSLLQGTPLTESLALTIDQLGFAFRDFHFPPNRHVPKWAWFVALTSVSVSVSALLIEWFIVRRRHSVKRFVPGVPVDSVRSKTHLIF